MKKGPLIVLALLLLAACGKQPVRRYEATFLTLFDTVTTIVGYSDSKEAFTAQARMIHDGLEEYHRLYDTYHTYEGVNNLKTVNDNAGAAPVKVDPRIIDLLLMAGDMYKRTGGKVDAAFGSVLSIWHEYRERGVNDPERAELPPMEALLEAASHTGFPRVVIDKEASTVYLPDPNMRLDVGAVAKGYAAEQVCRAAKQQGVQSLLISVGGNICAIGESSPGIPWQVGVENPDRESAEINILTVALRDQSLVTSGGYRRYYTVRGKEYHHVIDPDTLMPAGYFWTVSVICTDSGVADALSTALYNLPFEKGRALVEGMDHTEAVWIFPDGTRRFSSGFEAFIIE